MNSIPPEIFRAYDIRGIVPTSLNEDIVYQIGLALGTLAKEQKQSAIVVGQDHRVSSPALFGALKDGILATGMNVIHVGRVPTPALYFASIFLKTYSGVMITGSHCSPEYNGLKMVIAGNPIADEAIQALAKRIKEKAFQSGIGTVQEHSISDAYLEAIRSRISPLKKKIKMVIDAGHGMMSEMAPLLFEKLQCEVIPLYCDINPHFPHHHPDPSQPENLQDLIQAVSEHQADVGIAFDGDGDRIGVVTNTGKIIWPDRLLAVFAQDMLKTNPQATILYDVKCSRHLKSFITACGGKPLLWKTGHSHIKSKMKETNAVLAGEMSGHIFFGGDWYGFDDALFAAAKLISILSNQSLSSDEFFNLIPDSVCTPELKLAMAENKKFSFIENFIRFSQFSAREKIIIDGLRVEYDNGFGLIRASNTSPYLILRFEADTQEMLQFIQNEFKKNLLQMDLQLSLPF